MNLIADFEKWLKSRGYRPNTIRAYVRYANQFTQYVDILSATRADVSLFVTELGTPHKVKQALAALSTLFSYLIEIGLMDRNPAVGVRRPRLPITFRNFLTREEIEKMIEIADLDLRDSVAIRLGYFAALRVQELCSLKWEHISLSEPRIIIKGGKGGKDAIVYYNDRQTLLRLREWKNNMPRVKPGGWKVDPTRVFPYSPRTAENIVKRVAREAGIEKEIGYHDLRHARATHLRQSGWDIRKLQEFMRHKSILATMRYAHVAPEELIPS